MGGGGGVSVVICIFFLCRKNNVRHTSVFPSGILVLAQQSQRQHQHRGCRPACKNSSWIWRLWSQCCDHVRASTGFYYQLNMNISQHDTVPLLLAQCLCIYLGCILFSISLLLFLGFHSYFIFFNCWNSDCDVQRLLPALLQHQLMWFNCV